MLPREIAFEERRQEDTYVTVGEGEGQTSEKFGFREALEDFRNTNVEGVLSSAEVTKRVAEAASEVDAARTTREEEGKREIENVAVGRAAASNWAWKRQRRRVDTSQK